MSQDVYTPRDVLVHFYRDDESTSHVTEVKITDAGMEGNFGRKEAMSDGLLARMAKAKLREDGRYTQEELDSFTVFVKR